MKFHGLWETMPFTTPLQPYATYYALLIVSLLAITNGYTVFFPGKFTASDFLVSYIVFAIFLGLYFGHKIYYKTPWMTRVQDIDVTSGKAEIDRLCESEVERVPRNWLQRFWWWVV